MAVKGDRTRARLIDAACSLVEARGYFGAGLNEMLQAGGAPRGSLYHHFPGGKDQLIAEALAVSGREIEDLIRNVAEGVPDTGALVEAVLDALADRMQEAGYAKGCPITTVALETAATNDSLQRVCADVYDGWQRALVDRLVADGHAPGHAEDLACSLLALIEGALVLARAGRSRTPIERARRSVRALLGT
ncbi:TetR/AcrR family transcriptional repressor of lmrAB and yxaGH operons [Streptosporangium becharense]|uniref:TetR/AcrR family transcriptional repressor of lmrAB and yxaGH operons n=1 Tax=Streptosporangium becharense TaxID=1816182 RepID=A0A7W9IAN8_9ACTN|nr:TetR/AcrR family transcriptional regulator [Streptosporangium becharense]MBB2914225.1 TetR/AcrR family transcriptional repressor of lmrAB and yxaGH operons [Streptosporangium becharense]MBB5817252.1 TetR/AcrR family transcriptional repressor of lmrAB and yxaGH operons [Streptosporangium becharense]